MSPPVHTKKLLMIAGATAVGKTEISLKLAAHFDCPILSADSRQCYRELGIATAKPSHEVLAKVKHYFINTHTIHTPVSAAGFKTYALNILKEVYSINDLCIITGGSGLYIKAVCEGLDEIPAVSESIRKALETRLQLEGLEKLVMELNKVDPEYAISVDRENPRRIIRALEVYIGTGQPYSSFRSGKKQFRPFEVIKIGLHRDRLDLYNRIDQRMEEMISHGLFKEAALLSDFRTQKPLQTVGYQEVFGCMDGKYDQKESFRLLKRNSRRYAKRQLTWFRKDPEIKWFPAEDLQSIIDYLNPIIEQPRS